MKIVDIQRFINRFKVLTEAVTLPNIRQAIRGKKGMKEYPVVDDEKKWYEEHKSEILSTIEKALNVDDKTLQINLQKFDTDPYFTNDKPRKLKPKELLKALRKNFISQVERSRNTEDKTIGIEAQYEMMEMGNGVEVYAVYTPMANRHLTHTKLFVRGCFSPTWCIASSTANNYWNHYYLYEAEYPSVFIVAQKTKNGYNPIKYELKCDPHKSISFRDGKISLTEWVDEWRNPEQNEETYDETSLFKKFNISLEDLENTIRKLINSKKSSTFSKKYGKEMLNLYTEKINSKDEDTRMEYLTKACKNGTFINFYNKIDTGDEDYFLDELIRYDTLTETEVQVMNIQNNEKALSYLIKMKRCTHLSLEWANRYFDNNMIRRVYHSLPDDVLSMDEFDGERVREKIFNCIKNVKGLTEEYLNYLIKNEKFNNGTLKYVKDDKVSLTKCVDYLIKNDRIDNWTLKYVEDDKELSEKCVAYLIKNGKVDDDTLDYVENDKELLKICVEIIVKNGNVNDNTLKYVRNDKVLFEKCLEMVIKNGKVGNSALYYVENDKELLKICVEIIVKNGNVNNDTLKYVRNDKVLFEKCIEFLIKNNRINNYTLDYVKNDKDLLRKCVDNLISNNRVYDDTLEYVVRDEELLRKCVDYLISKNRITSLSILDYAKFDKESLRKCVDYIISKNAVTDKVLNYVKRDEDLTRKCVDNLILNNRVDDYTLYSIGYGLKNRAELERKCIEHLISKNRIYNSILDYVLSDGDLMRKCVDILISNNRVDNETLKYVRRDEESLRKCVEYLISKNKINKETLSNLFSWSDNISMIKKVLIYLVDKNEERQIYYALNGRYNKFDEENITTLCKILDEREMNGVLGGLLSIESSYGDYYIRLYEEILKRCSLLTKMISFSMLFAREKNLRINDTLNASFKYSKDDERLMKNLVKCFIGSDYKSYFDKALNDDYEGRYALYYLINGLETKYMGDYFEKSIENIEKFENTYKDFISFLKQNKEYSERAESWLRYPLFGETEEKDKITQMKNLYKLFERKYKENGRKTNEEIANIIREMIDIGFYQRIKTSYRPIVALVDGDDIPEDNVKMIEEILKQIGEENYNDRLLNYMTWNKKFYKFIPHIVDVLISKNDIGTSLEDVINDDGITDVNSAKKLANWIIKNKNTIDKDTKASVNFVKENHPEIYKELFGDKL